MADARKVTTRSAALLLCLGLLLGPPPAPAGDAPPGIAIIIDDMGYRLRDGRRAMALPAEVVYSFLPHTPHAPALARQARAKGSEILLHLPMEAAADNHLLGPGALTLAMDRDSLNATLRANLAAVPHAVGVNNHMGSLLTRQREPMTWLMEALRREGLAFIDSRTTAGSVASQAAAAASLPSAARDVFLDNVRETDHVRAQFRRLVATARRRGTALGIGHPHPVTLAVLASELAELEQSGVQLITLAELLARRGHAAAKEPALRAARQ